MKILAYYIRWHLPQSARNRAKPEVALRVVVARSATHLNIENHIHANAFWRVIRERSERGRIIIAEESARGVRHE